MTSGEGVSLELKEYKRDARRLLEYIRSHPVLGVALKDYDREYKEAEKFAYVRRCK